MHVYLFVKNDCPLCAPAKGLYEELGRALPAGMLPVLYNVDEDPGGLALFQFLELKSTPTVALVDSKTDDLIRFWAGEIPTVHAILEAIDDRN